MLISSLTSSFMWIVLVALVPALRFFPSLLVAWTSLGIRFPRPPTSQQHWWVYACHSTTLLWVFKCLFPYFLLFFRIPWSITFPHSDRGQEFGAVLLQVLFWIKVHIFSLGFDKRRAIPEGLYHVLFCCPGRYVLVMTFSSLTFANCLGWQICWLQIYTSVPLKKDWDLLLLASIVQRCMCQHGRICFGNSPVVPGFFPSFIPNLWLWLWSFHSVDCINFS